MLRANARWKRVTDGTISHASAREQMVKNRANGMKPEATGEAVKFAIEQPADVDVNESSCVRRRRRSEDGPSSLEHSLDGAAGVVNARSAHICA